MLFAALFAVLVPLAIWIYTLVFVFSSLWFAHYCLEALRQLRASREGAATTPVPAATPALPPAGAGSVSDVPFKELPRES